MRKQYPYLQESYLYQSDIEWKKRQVLAQIDNFLNQRQYVKITLLDWDEEPIKDIEGEISSGSISKNGDSPIRRTVQLTCAVDARSYSVDDGKADFAINKKIFIEIGVKNETDYYTEYPIFWFPEGVFFIGSFSINSGSNSSTVITLSLKDKMAMLTGDVGGTLPATTIFDSMDTQLPSGEYIEKKVLIYNIIQEAVHHYGGEDLNRIVIEGVPLRIRRIMQWIGDTPLYQISTSENANEDESAIGSSSGNFYKFTTEKPENESYIKYEKGDDVGYIMDDFVMTGELTGAPGESVTSILDKIKNAIGNYEYFYDVFGVFHFREIKNYYVTTQARTVLDEMAENDYLVEVNNSRSIYTFDDEKLLTSITVSPQYENIKNDYIVQGQTTVGDSNIVYPVRYHLVIDDKPKQLGIDQRQTIRQRIDNTDKIAEKQSELNKKKIGYNNSGKSLEDIFYKIRNLKNTILNDYDIISTKDKELLKGIQDYIGTSYTYKDLTPTNTKKQDNENDLLSKQLLVKLGYNKSLKEFITKDIDNYIEIETSDASDYHLTVLNEKISQLDIDGNIIKEALEVLDSDSPEFERLAKEQESIEIETQSIEDAIAFAKEKSEPVKANFKRLLEYIYTLWGQIIARKLKLFGQKEENSKIVSDWKVNDYDVLVLRDSPKITFSHNIEKIDNLDITSTNIYKFKAQNGADISKTLLPENEESFYENGELYKFLEIWKKYYNNEDESSELYDIESLQQEIEQLQAEHGTFNENVPRPSRNDDHYYGIYPTEEISTTDIQEMIIYTHPRTGMDAAAYVKIIDTSQSEQLPDVGNFNLIYKVGADSQTYYYWDGTTYQEVEILECYDNKAEGHLYYAYDWRTKLYLDGLKGVINGTDQGYYFAELSAFWPQTYDLVNQKFFGENELGKTAAPALGLYFLDFLDTTTTSFGEWSVDNIGRRSDVIVKEEINCLFQPEIPNVILLPAEETDLSLIGENIQDKVYRYGSSLESQLTLQQLREEAQRNFYPWTQVSSDIYSKLITGGYRNGAHDQIKYELYLHTRYQKSISLTSIPVFYLEPNSRVTINDTTTNTYGDFVIQSINLTLGPGANMSVTCNEILERF